MNERVDAAATFVGPADVELDAGGRLALYLAVGLGAGAVIALQIDIMRVFAVGNWTHFGSLVVSPRDARLRPHQRGDGDRQELVRAPLAGDRFGCARPVGAARGRRQSLHPAPRLQPDLSRLGPEPEMEARRDLPRLIDAVPRRRGVPRLRVPQEQQDVRPRLFRRSGRLGPERPRLSRRDVCLPAGRPDRRAAGAVGGLLRGVVLPSRRAARASRRSSSRPWSPSAAISSSRRISACRASPSTTTRAPPTRGGCPKRRRSTRAGRRSASSKPTRPPTCISRRASPTTPASTCRKCRPTPISASTSTATARSASCAISPTRRSAYFRYLPMDYPYVIKKAPKTFVVQFGGGISTEVALSSGSKDVTVAEGNRAILEAFRSPVFRDFTGDILSKVHVVDYEGRHFLAQTGEKFDVIDLSLADFDRPVQPRRLRRGGEVRLHRGGDGDLHARPQRRRRAGGHHLEQGRAAEIGAQALRHHGGGLARARRRPHGRLVLRRLVLSLDRDRALQARRLFRRRDRRAAQAYARPVVRRDLFAGLLLRRLADRPHPRRLRRAVLLDAGQRAAELVGQVRRRSDRAARRRVRRRARRAAGRKPTRACCLRPSWDASPGIRWSTAAGPRSPSATSSTPAS